MKYREKTSTKGYDLNKTPSEMTQQELYLEIARLTNENDKLKRTKKFGLVWENKNDAKVEEVRRSAPILVEDSTKRVINDPNDVNHVLINGDNFQAMTALRATHAGKVDVIYIDPPYNTGNKDFIYNDNYLDKEDGYRHSKWLSFMQKRLILAKELLSETGVIFVSIDDNEQARLKLLMDDVFGAERFVTSAIRATNSAKNNSKTFSVNHEYFLVYSMTPVADLQGEKWSVKKNNVDEYIKRVKLLKSRGVSGDELAEELKELTSYPRFIDMTNYWHSDERGVYQKADLGGVKNGNTSPVFNPLTGENDPVPPGGFRYSKDKLEGLVREDRIHFHTDGSLPRLKRYIDENLKQNPKSIMSDDQRPDATLMKNLGLSFDNPKQLAFMKRIISIFKQDAIILDFFAGSGTTAHAVAELNKEDGGRRQCILITDGGKTETTGESSKNASENAVNIAEEITYERVKRVLTGENWADGKEHEPLGGNLFYLNTVVKYVGTIDAKSKEPYFCPSNSTTFSLDTGLWHPILEEVGASAEYQNLEHDYKLFALPKDEDGKQNYALTINATDWEFPAFKEWFDKNMPEDSTVFLYADNYSHGGCEWMEELETGTYPRLTEVNITKRLVNNHNWVAHSFLKTDI